MKKYNYSAKLRNALNAEDKNIDILEVITRKDMSTRRDVMQLTGLPRCAFNVIFADDVDEEERALRFDFPATGFLSHHVQRMDLTPTQRVVSELLWKWMQDDAVRLITQQFHQVTGRWIDEDYSDDEAFWEETYEITEGDLAYAAEVVKRHLSKVREDQCAA